MRRSRLGFLQEPMVIYSGMLSFNRKGEFNSDYFAVVGDTFNQKGIVIGFLSKMELFGTISVSFRGSQQIQMWANGDDTRLRPMDSMTIDLAALNMCDLDDSNSISSYLDMVAEYLEIVDISQPQTGWCSWRCYYQDISHSIIEENLEVLKHMRKEVPFDLIQIDDGYQREVGDWLEFIKIFQKA